MLKKSLTKLAFFLLSLLILFFNAYPNYYAYSHTQREQVFSSQASWFDPWDINLYVSAIRWGQRKGILLENIYTTLPNQPIFIYPLYTLSGVLFPKINPYLVFHLLAAFFGFLLMFVVWFILGIFLKEDNKKILTLLLISLGGGLGWLVFPTLPSADLFMTGFTFLSHFQRAHEALGMIFYFLSLVFFYLSREKNDSSFSLLSFICLAFLIIFYPFYLISYTLIIGFYSYKIYQKTKQKKSFFILITIIALVSPILLTYFSNLRSNPTFSSVLGQNLTSQSFFALFLGYGILIPLWLIQLIKSPKTTSDWFLNSWVIISLILSFLPLGFARFYLRGLFLPIILAILVNLKIVSRFFRVSQKVIILGLIFLLPVSSFYITYRRLAETKKNNHWFYLSLAEKNVLDFLDQNTPEDSRVLSAYTLGNYIPANTHNRVYFGHLIQTPNSAEKINNIIKFYANNFSEQEAKVFLEENQINYVYYGSEEQSIHQTYQPNKSFSYQFLQPIFQQDKITIFGRK